MDSNQILKIRLDHCIVLLVVKNSTDHRTMRLIFLLSSNRSAGWVCKTHRAGGAENVPEQKTMTEKQSNKTSSKKI